MKQLNLLIFLALFFFVAVMSVHGTEGGPRVRQVEDFSRFEAGTFPEGWKCFWTQKKQSRQVYAVKVDEAPFLEARAVEASVPIAKEFEYHLDDYPFLQWQWRVLAFPEGADERYRETGDSAAGIYVIFPGMLRPNTIKYVWSASLPAGTTLNSPFGDKTKIVVLRNHSDPVGTWVTEKVNVYEDYKRLFGRDPEPVQAIGIMSDSNDTRSRAEAHYRALCVSRD